MRHGNGNGRGAGLRDGSGRSLRQGKGRHRSAHVSGPCTLDALRGGDTVEIVHVNDEHARVNALRFGMAEGSRAECVTRVPGGPIVMRSGRQEIAVGRKLARRIEVRHVNCTDARKAG